MKRTGILIAAAALASCWKSTPVQQPVAVIGDVSIELASVSLGDDCGDDTAATADDTPAPSASRAGPPGSMHSSSIQEDSVSGDVACIPTAMQLSVRGQGTGEAAIRVKSVALVDSNGRVIGNLTPGAATRFSGDSYVAWNQHVRGGETLQASYKLRGLDWSKLPGGRWAAEDRTFTLRVTIEAGAGERTMTKAVAITGVRPEPAGVVT